MKKIRYVCPGSKLDERNDPRAQRPDPAPECSVQTKTDSPLAQTSRSGLPSESTACAAIVAPFLSAISTGAMVPFGVAGIRAYPWGW